MGCKKLSDAISALNIVKIKNTLEFTEDGKLKLATNSEENFQIVKNDDTGIITVDTDNDRIGIHTETPGNALSVDANKDDDTNYISVGGADDKTRGFEIGSEGNWKWANYIFEGEEGDTQYFANGNSGRDILVLQSGGRAGLNVPTLIGNVEILRIVQTSSNTYATITCERPHSLANNTPIKISSATNAKFNGNFVVSSVTTMTFRITGLEVGAVTEEPTDAKVVLQTTIPAGFAIFPQYFDSVYAFDKGADTGVGTGYTNITAEMRTSFGTNQIVATTAGSYLYIGKQCPWRATAVNIATASAGSSGIVVEYSTETGWTALTTSATSGNVLVDGTNRLRQDGAITWDITTFKHLWKQKILTVNPAPQYTQNLYWIRISLTGAVTTAPVAYSVSNHGTDRLAVYAQASDVNPTMAVDFLGRIGFMPPEIETKYALGSLAGIESSKFEVVAEDGYRSDFVYYLANNDGAAHPAIVLAKSKGTIGSKTALANGDDVGAVYGYGWDGARFREIGGMVFENVGTASSGNISGRMIFKTRNTTNNPVERMRIDENGNVGIGTGAATITNKLEVSGNVKVSGNMLKMTGITTATRDGLTPVAGDIIYNTTVNKHQGYNGSTWNDLY